MTKKHIGFAAIFLIVLCAAGLAGWWWFVVEPVAKIERTIRAGLVDPDSARFDDVHFYRKSGAGCGRVNAKNRMGGYTGFTFFIVFPDGIVELDPMKGPLPTDSQQRVAELQKGVKFL